MSVARIAVAELLCKQCAVDSSWHIDCAWNVGPPTQEGV